MCLNIFITNFYQMLNILIRIFKYSILWKNSLFFEKEFSFLLSLKFSFLNLYYFMNLNNKFEFVNMHLNQIENKNLNNLRLLRKILQNFFRYLSFNWKRLWVYISIFEDVVYLIFLSYSTENLLKILKFY